MGRYNRVLERRKLASGKRVFALGLDQIVDGNQNADRDETVGKIECRPMEPRPIEIEKIDDFAIGDSIDEVADRSAQNKGESRDQTGFSIRQAPQHHYDEDDCYH